MQGAETKGLEGKFDDENSGSAEFPGVKTESRLLLRDKLVLLDVQLLDFRVQRRAGNFPLKHAYVWALLKPSERALSFADGVIAFYDTKYTYNFWRPVTAVRGAALDGTLEH
jgi:hypothetical protein